MRRAVASGLFVAGIALAGSGCATDIRIDVDRPEDLSTYRSWDWLPVQWEAAPAARGVDRGLEALVRGAIVRGLLERGYRRTSVGRPDFLVAYHVTLQRELVLRTETPAMQTLAGFHREGGFEITASRFSVERYETGTLVLVVADAGSQQRVWRATAVRRVRESFRTEAERVVLEVFDRFPSAAWF
jgi:hypothetical protein